MRIVVIGDGKIGFTITQALVREGHDLVVIDNQSAALKQTEDSLDVQVLEGNGASVSVQKEAGVADADLMIAVTIILTRVLSINIGGAFRISLGSVCTMLTGLWFGPAAGFICGALSDAVGLLISPSGTWMPLITLSAGIWGVIPALMRPLMNGSRKRKYGMMCAAVLVTSLFCQLGLTTMGLIILYGRGIIPGRVLQFAGSTPVYCLVMCLLYYSPLTRYVREDYIPEMAEETQGSL